MQNIDIVDIPVSKGQNFSCSVLKIKLNSSSAVIFIGIAVNGFVFVGYNPLFLLDGNLFQLRNANGTCVQQIICQLFHSPFVSPLCAAGGTVLMVSGQFFKREALLHGADSSTVSADGTAAFYQSRFLIAELFQGFLHRFCQFK